MSIKYILILLIILVLIYKLSTNKCENMNYIKKDCPIGFVPSLNQKACVLPGEKLPGQKIICDSSHKYVDGVCRIPLYNRNIPAKWCVNNTKTGIKLCEHINKNINYTKKRCPKNLYNY